MNGMSVAQAFSTRETVLEVRHVNVSFPIYHGGSRSLKKSLLFKGSAGRLAHDGNHRITVQALRDISLSLATGDRVALIGANGAGKTTLLRVMAGIYEPTTGDAIIRGRISPMFDIGLGIDTDLSGYDNIRIRAMILGLSNSEIDKRMADIAHFTELGEYLEMPVRTYSSGMILRLTFAVATCFEPEILLMDEWIVAGDESFMAKAEKRLTSFVDRASVLVLASHNIEICQRWCNKGLWMDQGRIKAYGDIGDVIEQYRRSIEAV
ncbi:ABC transporter ATP-binding protein [Tardiphaga sp. P9-11]|uniref:ABC transporter ATP-binding protein n=1 Tax=Tardiphaga sp. P9-11 TaxID=2024614 RepID=UPI0032E367A8